MNILLLSALALVSADDYLELPIFRTSSLITVPAKDGSSGVTFEQKSRYANIMVNGVSYESHLEPESGDVWVYENSEDNNKAPDEEYLKAVGHKPTMGLYYFENVSYDKANFNLPYAVMNNELFLDEEKVSGLGLAPRGSPFFDFPMVNSGQREWYPTFGDLVKTHELAQTDTFTINFDSDASNDGKLVYGAMDLSRFTGKLHALYKSRETKLIDANFAISGINTHASLAVEDPNTYLDDEVVASLAKKFGAKWDGNHGLYKISSMPHDDLVLDFDGFEIRVPSADIWVQDEKVSEDWYLTIRPISSHILTSKKATLGADIMRSTYIVYDLGRNFAAIAQANRDSGPSKYQAIPAEGIPNEFFDTPVRIVGI